MSLPGLFGSQIINMAEKATDGRPQAVKNTKRLQLVPPRPGDVAGLEKAFIHRDDVAREDIVRGSDNDHVS